MKTVERIIYYKNKFPFMHANGKGQSNGNALSRNKPETDSMDFIEAGQRRKKKTITTSSI